MLGEKAPLHCEQPGVLPQRSLGIRLCLPAAHTFLPSFAWLCVVVAWHESSSEAFPIAKDRGDPAWQFSNKLFSNKWNLVYISFSFFSFSSLKKIFFFFFKMLGLTCLWGRISEIFGSNRSIQWHSHSQLLISHICKYLNTPRWECSSLGCKMHLSTWKRISSCLLD